MILLAFFGTLNLFLLSRLWLTFKDEGAELKTIIKMSLVPLLSLIFVETGMVWFLLLAILLLSPLVMYLTEKNSANIYRSRGITLLLHIAALGLVFGFAGQAGLNGRAEALVLDNPLFSAGEIFAVQILLFGGLLAMNEMNIVLRYLMYALNLAPIGKKKSQSNISGQQYNTGRVIGMLERIFIYSFAISGQFAAIGFILTAKGVVRYHDFEDRAFAEYVLIGTLLSALLAMAVALMVKTFI
ncbi:hypothetical protein [Rhodohalobacter sp. 8-1]|uniref:hypothetical protein n=1 Tax=Rhodohalobacter sp. 8-1 TaxID=3131972 RepID=UPI0030ED18CB